MPKQPEIPRGKIHYTGVRKMQWDALWHALFEHDRGSDNWDRVDRKRALEIEARLSRGEKVERP